MDDYPNLRSVCDGLICNNDVGLSFNSRISPSPSRSISRKKHHHNHHHHHHHQFSRENHNHLSEVNYERTNFESDITNDIKPVHTSTPKSSKSLYKNQKEFKNVKNSYSKYQSDFEKQTLPTIFESNYYEKTSSSSKYNNGELQNNSARRNLSKVFDFEFSSLSDHSRDLINCTTYSGSPQLKKYLAEDWRYSERTCYTYAYSSSYSNESFYGEICPIPNLARPPLDSTISSSFSYFNLSKNFHGQEIKTETSNIFIVVFLFHILHYLNNFLLKTTYFFKTMTNSIYSISSNFMLKTTCFFKGIANSVYLICYSSTVLSSNILYYSFKKIILNLKHFTKVISEVGLTISTMWYFLSNLTCNIFQYCKQSTSKIYGLINIIIECIYPCVLHFKLFPCNAVYYFCETAKTLSSPVGNFINNYFLFQNACDKKVSDSILVSHSLLLKLYDFKNFIFNSMNFNGQPLTKHIVIYPLNYLYGNVVILFTVFTTFVTQFFPKFRKGGSMLLRVLSILLKLYILICFFIILFGLLWLVIPRSYDLKLKPAMINKLAEYYRNNYIKPDFKSFHGDSYYSNLINMFKNKIDAKERYHFSQDFVHLSEKIDSLLKDEEKLRKHLKLNEYLSIDYTNKIEIYMLNNFFKKSFLPLNDTKHIKKELYQTKNEIENNLIFAAKTVLNELKENLTVQSNLLQASDLPVENLYNYTYITSILHDALLKYDSDKTGMYDYALETAGGAIISTRCTESYVINNSVYSFLGIPFWYAYSSPRRVIQPRLVAGECWAFKGSIGYLVIQTSEPIIPSKFSLEHIPKSLSPTGEISSAPKNFTVFALQFEKDPNPIKLGDFVYDKNSTPLQYFDVQVEIKNPIPLFELVINSNNGNIAYTCLYRFRIHGEK